MRSKILNRWFSILSIGLLSAPAFAIDMDKSAMKHGSLGLDMQVIAVTYAKIGQQINDKTKNKDSEALTQTMIDRSMKAKNEMPPAAKAMKPEERDKLISKYKADLQTMLEHLTIMKKAFMENNNAEAKLHYEALRPWAASGHEKVYQ